MFSDQSRSRRSVHSRGKVRRLKSRLQPLLAVMSGVTLFLGAVVLFLGLIHEGMIGERQVRLGSWMLAGGIVLWLVYYLAFRLPVQLEERRTRALRRRAWQHGGGAEGRSVSG